MLGRLVVGLLLFSAAAFCFALFASAQTDTRRTGPRKLAPGVLTVIQPHREEKETRTDPRPIVEITEGPFRDWTPKTRPKSTITMEIAKKRVFRRRIWCLEFAFKPVRMIDVDIPQPDGRMLKKRIWYMVYRIRNTGTHMAPAAAVDKYGHKTYITKPDDFKPRFFPQFVLATLDQKTGDQLKEYLDRVNPLAVEKIQERERPGTKLYNSVQISQFGIPVSTAESSKAAWGVVTWEDIDPRTDYFAIYIQGLTNAYKWADPPGAFKEGDAPGTGRRYAYKTLRLNWWRPGDAVYSDSAAEDEAEIQYGIPDKVDHEWLFR